ncbi:hypothetical protein QYM36_007731 [Artemia franciscana]|uniref:Uncharacterized protein n=1 Tax=Artemia franciscana TaxID=6661 RepID=A0AA88LKD2_ARTSF|nr:hypothetical protein QYM36_007731 [Artemia franciscana]
MYANCLKLVVNSMITEVLQYSQKDYSIKFATTTKYRELKYDKFELKPNQSVVEYSSLVKQACEEKFGNNVNPSIIINDLVNRLPDNYTKLLLEKKPTAFASALSTLSHAEDVQTALRLRKSGGGLEVVNAVGSTNNRGRGNFNRRGNIRHGYEARQLPKMALGIVSMGKIVEIPVMPILSHVTSIRRTESPFVINACYPDISVRIVDRRKLGI